MKRRRVSGLAAVVLFSVMTAFPADGVDVSGVFGMAELTEAMSIVIWMPVTEGEAVSGFSWYNNDALAVFRRVRAMAGVVEHPDDLSNAVIVGEEVVGRSSDWSQFTFDRPLASDSDGIYIVFDIPRGGELVHEGEGGGYGVGFQGGSGFIRCWIWSDVGGWDAVDPGFQMAVIPAAEIDKRGDVLVLQRGQGGGRLPTEEGNTPLESAEMTLLAIPNPFNPVTEIEYTTVTSGVVNLGLYNVRGQIVRMLVHAQQEPGTHHATWNGQDHAGRSLPSGMYLARLQVGSMQVVERLTLLK